MCGKALNEKRYLVSSQRVRRELDITPKFDAHILGAVVR